MCKNPCKQTWRDKPRSVASSSNRSTGWDLCAWIWVCISLRFCATARVWATGWRIIIGCLKLQVIFRKRATNYRALLRKMTCKDKASCGSSPPCTGCECVSVWEHARTSLVRCGWVWVYVCVRVCERESVYVGAWVYMGVCLCEIVCKCTVQSRG